MQGIFICNEEGAMVRPTSKKQVKEMVATDPSKVEIEATSMFGNEYEGTLSKDVLEKYGKILFVGPDPHVKRNFYGSINLNKKGEMRVQ